jgi:hypothetical protein
MTGAALRYEFISIRSGVNRAGALSAQLPRTPDSPRWMRWHNALVNNLQAPILPLPRR